MSHSLLSQVTAVTPEEMLRHVVDRSKQHNIQLQGRKSVAHSAMASDAGKMDRGPISFIVLKSVETLCVCVLFVFLGIFQFSYLLPC